MEVSHPASLDTALLSQLLRAKRGKLSLRQAASEAGVSFSTFQRVENGSQPDLAAYQLLCRWLEVSPARFFTDTADDNEFPLEIALAALRKDPKLTPANAKLICDVVEGMYQALAAEPPTGPQQHLIATHLMSANTLRAGVPERLSSILQGIDQQLTQRVKAGKL